MTYGEALRLTAQLCSDSTSHVATALGKWDRPVSDAAMVLMDLFDLQHKKADKRAKPYPRPWPDPNQRRMGSASMTPDQLRAFLDQHSDTTEGG